MDYNDFYVKSLGAGAQPDSFGNIQHTPASMATFAMNEEHERFFNESGNRPLDHVVNNGGIWNWLFNGK